jgi:hypothetical protein
MYQPSFETLTNSILAYLDETYISGGGIDHTEGMVYFISDRTGNRIIFCLYDLSSMQTMIPIYNIPLI